MTLLTLLRRALILGLLVLLPLPGFGMISVGHLTKAEAAKLGITMKQRSNGDAGTLVWVEFRKAGDLDPLTYVEMQVRTASGKHLASARLEPHRVEPDQPKDLVSYSFSVDPAQLEHCAFMLVTYGSRRGDVGYLLNVKDFLGR